ncbi:MAG TPA: hypothetical protein ENN36_06845 [Candidatus Bathyarchaeota archaeon]|nr:hypothetical protein [Candidatus Bathyarchaeota archaeon]
MKNNVKLFPGSVIGLLLGVLLAAPLLYTNVALAPAADGPESLLGVELTYAYIEKITGNYVPYGDFLPDSQNPNATEPGISRVNYFVACNLTRLSEDIDPCDAKLLVYLVKFYSDNGFVGNLGMYEGLIYNLDLVNLPGSENETGAIYNIGRLRERFFELFKSGEFFGNSNSLGVVGGSHGIWAVGESRGHGMSGVSDEWGSSFGEPETMYLSVSLLGWIALRGNSTDTIILEEPKVVADAQMEKFGDGFLYNTLIPEDEISNLDPLNPYGKLFEQMGNLD